MGCYSKRARLQTYIFDDMISCNAYVYTILWYTLNDEANLRVYARVYSFDLAVSFMKMFCGIPKMATIGLYINLDRQLADAPKHMYQPLTVM